MTKALRNNPAIHVDCVIMPTEEPEFVQSIADPRLLGLYRYWLRAAGERRDAGGGTSTRSR